MFGHVYFLSFLLERLRESTESVAASKTELLKPEVQCSCTIWISDLASCVACFGVLQISTAEGCGPAPHGGKIQGDLLSSPLHLAQFRAAGDWAYDPRHHEACGTQCYRNPNRGQCARTCLSLGGMKNNWRRSFFLCKIPDNAVT